MSGCCAGRVAVVTGGGRGIGRGYAIELAHQGASVVVNDLGVEVNGTSRTSWMEGSVEWSVAQSVVDEITSAGGRATADRHDVSDPEGARQLVEHALEAFGDVHVVVNNAGILRDRMLVNLSWEDWSDVVQVHLGGTFAVSHWAARHWRERQKAGQPVDARLINITSGAGLYGNVGQANYAAAKAGIVGFTRTAAIELNRYGVTVNAVAPGGRTRMTDEVFAEAMRTSPEDWDPFDPANVAPLVAWLASADSRWLTGQVIEAWGGRISVVEGWRPGPTVDARRRWEPSEVGQVVTDLVGRLPPPPSPPAEISSEQVGPGVAAPRSPTAGS